MEDHTGEIYYKSWERLYDKSSPLIMVEMGCWPKAFFWRFPREFRVDAIKGNTIWVKKQLPLYRRKAKRIKDPIVK